MKNGFIAFLKSGTGTECDAGAPGAADGPAVAAVESGVVDLLVAAVVISSLLLVAAILGPPAG